MVSKKKNMKTKN